MRQMIGEEEQQGEADKQQHNRDGHRESREVIHPVPTRNPYLKQSRRAVAERGDEHAQHDLVRAVARRKLCSNRGENCVDESCSATTANPSNSAMTVTMGGPVFSG
jgi:hypothetical protein